ncbi:MAG: TonB-dependent receptor [Roseateles sp.]|uniref:TonB-dependent receptor n=1 Tax=Roseateles sp. TaxID=1971397 RepID=UPI0039EB9521
MRPPEALSSRRPQPLARAVVLILAAWPAVQAGAQAQDKAQLGTVVVTAERKQENAKDVPVSVTLMKPEQLEAIATSGQDVRVLAAKVPSLNIESSNGRTFPRFYIRGYGNTDFSTYASQPVSLVYDDVVQESAILKGFPIFDLENVEVLRGPQGTLFGRNTPAGVVKFSSARPSLDGTEGYVNLSAGTHSTFNADAAVNLPLGTAWALRVSALAQHRGDWVTVRSADPANLYNGRKTEGYDDRAARVQLLYRPDARFNALFNLHARDLDGSARVFRANIIKQGTNDLVDGFDPKTVATNGANTQQFRSWGGSANLSWDLGDHSLHAITGYEAIGKYYTRGDIDGGDATNTPFPVETAGGVKDHGQFSQELRIASKFKGPLNYQAGVYYFNESLQGESYGYNSATAAQTSYTLSRQKNDAWAVFGSLAYDLSADLKLRAGLRYTRDEKRFDMRDGFADPRSKAISGAKATGDLSLNYRVSPDTSVYARVATGFRGASFGTPTSGQDLTSANPETNTSYEAGVKADLLERRARLSFSVFSYDVKNQQLTAVGGASNVTALINAKKSHGQGFEFEGEALLTRDFRVSLGVSYNDTKIEDPSLRVPVCGSGKCTPLDPISTIGTGRYASIDGNPLPQAPKWITTATARWGIPLANGDELYLYTDWSYRSKINFFLYESVEFTGKSLLEGGLKLGYNWGGGQYEASLFCRNCTGQVRATGGIDFNNLTGFINDPRTVGAQFRANF